jgi:hypothetical protein
LQLKQEDGDVDPVIELAFPAVHLEHWVAPYWDEYDPASHGVHTSVPSLEEYEPIGQEAQLPLLGPTYLPAAQTLHDEDMLDPVDSVICPLGQERQDVDPNMELYEPNGQGMQSLGEEPAEGE